MPAIVQGIEMWKPSEAGKVKKAGMGDIVQDGVMAGWHRLVSS